MVFTDDRKSALEFLFNKLLIVNHHKRQTDKIVGKKYCTLSGWYLE